MQATALANECTDYLNQSQSGIHTVQDHESNSQPIQQDPEPSPTYLCKPEVLAAHGSGPTTTSLSLSGDDSSILGTFQNRFLQFSPERFQELKTQASTLRGSSAMRVWNIAWLRCQEARQQLQERIQDTDNVYHQQLDSNQCECHYVDVVSTNVQTSSPGGQSLVVQSTPGPRHPQWEGIVSGAVDLGKRRPILGSHSANTTNVACCNIIVKPEDHSDAGNKQESKVIPPSPHR